jgi:hypothetical protein
VLWLWRGSPTGCWGIVVVGGGPAGYAPTPRWLKTRSGPAPKWTLGPSLTASPLIEAAIPADHTSRDHAISRFTGWFSSVQRTGARSRPVDDIVVVADFTNKDIARPGTGRRGTHRLPGRNRGLSAFSALWTAP